MKHRRIQQREENRTITSQPETWKQLYVPVQARASPPYAAEVEPFPSMEFGSPEDMDKPKHERDARAHISRYSELIFARNSPFDLVLLNLSISSSIASTGESGFSTLRSTQMRVRSSFGISSSSFRVPER